MSPASVGVRLGHWCSAGAASAMAARGDGESSSRPSSSAELTDSRFLRAATAEMRLLLFVVVRLAVRCRRRPIALPVASRLGDRVLLIAAAAEAEAEAGPAPPVPPPTMSSIQTRVKPWRVPADAGGVPAWPSSVGRGRRITSVPECSSAAVPAATLRNPCSSTLFLVPSNVLATSTCRIVGLKYG